MLNVLNRNIQFIIMYRVKYNNMVDTFLIKSTLINKL